MSKGSGMGRKRIGNKLEKGLDRCNSSRNKQCGNGNYVSKGSKKQNIQYKQESLYKKSVGPRIINDDE